MVEIIFESYKTSIDNENWVASGWKNSSLSKLGLWGR